MHNIQLSKALLHNHNLLSEMRFLSCGWVGKLRHELVGQEIWNCPGGQWLTCVESQTSWLDY